MDKEMKIYIQRERGRERERERGMDIDIDVNTDIDTYNDIYLQILISYYTDIEVDIWNLENYED